MLSGNSGKKHNKVYTRYKAGRENPEKIRAMASLMHLQSHLLDNLLASTLSSKQPRLDKCKRLEVLCCRNNHHTSDTASKDNGSYRKFSRRQLVLLQTTVAAISFPSVALAANRLTDVGPDFRMYSDESKKFKIMIPKDWEVGSGESNGVNSLTGFYPSEPSASNVTVAITGLGADYTGLESFGKVDAFAENLVSGLDRSWQRPPGVEAKLIDSKAANGLYYIEYTLQKPGESRRHLYAVLGMANNGVYNQLYTVTGQFVDEDSEKYGSQIEKAVASFRLV